jgi:ubiquinone/menaquinone biosynthesis C-methylase UbiE
MSDTGYDGSTKYDAAVAANYERDRIGEAHWQAEQDCVARHAASHRLGTVLDLPVGTGRFLEMLAAADAYVGVDISEHMLAEARARATSLALKQVDLLKGDALALPFEAGRFDTTLCFRLAHLLPPALIPGLLAELARVTRGTLLLQAYVAQAAAPGTWKNSPVRRALGKAVRAVKPAPAKPWSHIESFNHPATLFDDAAAAAGLKTVARHALGDYAGTHVVVFELAK